MKIVGFYPPEKFAKVLDYIDGQHYKHAKLSEYLRSDQQTNDSDRIMVNTAIFEKPPFNLEPESYGGVRLF